MATITTKRGDTWRMTWTYQQADGAPLDLTGASARLQVRHATTGALLLGVGTATGELVITPAEGLITLSVPAATMAALEPGNHRMDLELTQSDGSVQSTETLTLKLVEDITRD